MAPEASSAPVTSVRMWRRYLRNSRPRYVRLGLVDVLATTADATGLPSVAGGRVRGPEVPGSVSRSDMWHHFTRTWRGVWLAALRHIMPGAFAQGARRSGEICRDRPRVTRTSPAEQDVRVQSTVRSKAQPGILFGDEVDNHGSAHGHTHSWGHLD